MKKVLKGLCAIIVALTVLGALLAGVHALNAKRYAPPKNALHAGNSYVTNDRIRAVEGQYLKGFHFSPVEPKYQGTVVVFGGSEGSPGYHQAKSLSDQGFEVLALYFFGQPNQQKHLAEVPLEFFDEVTTYIEAHINSPKPVTVIGSSKGAELVANLASRGAAIDHIALFTPSEYTYQGLTFGDKEFSSFTSGGNPLPFLKFRDANPGASAKMAMNMLLGLPVTYRPIYEPLPERTPNSDAARIPIENFRGTGVLFAGDQDAMWPGDVAARGLARRNSHLDTHVYPNAGHVFSSDITALGKGWKAQFGGTVEGNREAKERSDQTLSMKLAEWHPQA